MKHRRKIIPKLVQNPSEIDQKRPQIDKNTSFERFRRQIAPSSLQGSRLLLQKSPFGPKGRPGVITPNCVVRLFADPATHDTPKPPKIAFLSILVGFWTHFHRCWSLFRSMLGVFSIIFDGFSVAPTSGKRQKGCHPTVKFS